MNELGFLPILLGVCIVLAAGTLAYLGWRMERRRTEALVCLAARLGMNFSSERDRDLAARFKALRGLHEGNDRYAWNVLSGPYGGSPFMVFDFHYETESTDSEGRRQTSHHYLHAVLLELPRTFPNLHVSPEGMFSKIAQALGYDDIDFESAEFSRRYCVRSADKKFAYDFCNARMIDFLLEQAKLSLEVRDDTLAFVYNGRMNPEALVPKLDLACAVRERMPDYLFA
jgi:hypothetical protein